MEQPETGALPEITCSGSLSLTPVGTSTPEITCSGSLSLTPVGTSTPEDDDGE